MLYSKIQKSKLKKNSSYLLIILLALTVFLSALCSKFLPLNLKMITYTISYICQEIVLSIIPLLILPLIVNNIVNIASGAIRWILFILLLVFFSNSIAALSAYLLSIKVIPTIIISQTLNNNITAEHLYPILNLKIPKPNMMLISIIGLLFGIFFKAINNTYILKIINRYNDYTKIILEKIFIFFIPVYVFGINLKLAEEIDFLSLLLVFGQLILFIIIVHIFYICALFLLLARGKLSEFFIMINNTMKASIVGFSTMSSLVTLPTTLKSVDSITKACSMAKLSVISTVNFHDIGDSIALSIGTLAIFYLSHGHLPPPEVYILCSLAISIAQFSAISVPGGSVIIFMPLIVKYLNFTDDMISIFMIFSVCVESLGTGINVAGNCALSIFISQIYHRFKSKV